ncbi:hypothetical protein MNB_SV-13-2026 [hydrothermal vent metagenome]|uniref:Uncharacterized protein n=1 Tax=hydrothermal vent metagenome TaxID=652676 RepID=A0A1W1BXI8_9ZZZZ
MSGSKKGNDMKMEIKCKRFINVLIVLESVLKIAKIKVN